MQTTAAAKAESPNEALSDREILAQYSWVVSSLAKRLSEGHREVREDLEQIGLAALIEAGRKYQPGKQALHTFVYLRLRGSMIDFLRKERVHYGLVSLDEPVPSSTGESSLAEHTASEQETVDEIVLQKEQQHLLHIAMSALPKATREILVLKFYDNASDDEIAQTLGVHRTTALRHVRDAADLLKAQMKKLGAL